MKKSVNQLLPAALAAVRAPQGGILLADGVSILKEYDGYVASFAPSVITAGLWATLSFYFDKHKDKNDGKPYRNHILRLLGAIYVSRTGTDQPALVQNDLLETALNVGTGSVEERQLRQALIEAATALKLAMRNFRQAEDEKDLYKPESQSQSAV